MASLIQHTSALVLLALVSAAFRSTAPQANTTRSSPTTQIVLLGTGTPGWDPDSSGPATAIVVNGTPYLIDFGPGVVRRAGAAYRKGVTALLPTNLHVVFLNHRHVDHTVGYADLIFSPAQDRGARTFPLEVYGPKGLNEMTEHIVISGDTTPTQSVIDNCQNCDVLIHEAYSMNRYNAVSADAQAMRRRLHTSTMQLAELAGKAKPGLLILYHRSNAGGTSGVNPEKAFLEEIRSAYAGKVVAGHDLDIY